MENNLVEYKFKIGKVVIKDDRFIGKIITRYERMDNNICSNKDVNKPWYTILLLHGGYVCCEESDLKLLTFDNFHLAY